MFRYGHYWACQSRWLPPGANKPNLDSRASENNTEVITNVTRPVRHHRGSLTFVAGACASKARLSGASEGQGTSRRGARLLRGVVK